MPCRSTAATGSSRSTRWRSSCATPRSCSSTRARRRSSGWSSPARRCSRAASRSRRAPPAKPVVTRRRSRLPSRQLSAFVTATSIAGLGFAIGLAGDACHVASGTTHYEWSGVPEIWRSALWFPFLVAGGVLLLAWSAERLPLRPIRPRRRADVPAGAAAVLALYALTATLRDEPTTVSVVLVGALAIAIAAWWDPSLRALIAGVAFALAGPLVEIAIVEVGAAGYASDADGLAGVAPWLPCLYFAAGAVGSQLWSAIARDGEPATL